ncbi:unnamed protein product [Schistosoma guineensis]|nr:unnamed protein product [Schistosoma guineensis]
MPKSPNDHIHLQSIFLIRKHLKCHWLFCSFSRLFCEAYQELYRICMYELSVCSFMLLTAFVIFSSTEYDLFPLVVRAGAQWSCLACPVVVLLTFVLSAGFR